MKKYLITTLVFILVVAGLYGYFIAGNQLRAWRAINTGENYVSKLYSDYTIAGKNCQGEDTDNNGYVTCNFRLKYNSPTPNDTEKTITLQCPTFIKSYQGTSCKEVGFTVNTQ